MVTINDIAKTDKMAKKEKREMLKVQKLLHFLDLHMGFLFFCDLCGFLHLSKIWYDNPENTMTTHPHCFVDRGLPLSNEETTMLTNLRVVVMVVLAREPNRLMVRNMQIWPTAPQMQ
jgi:hypothetical protein